MPQHNAGKRAVEEGSSTFLERAAFRVACALDSFEKGWRVRGTDPPRIFFQKILLKNWFDFLNECRRHYEIFVLSEIVYKGERQEADDGSWQETVLHVTRNVG